MYTESHALGTRANFQLEMLTINLIYGIVYFGKIILEISQNISEIAPSSSACAEPALKGLIPNWGAYTALAV